MQKSYELFPQNEKSDWYLNLSKIILFSENKEEASSKILSFLDEKKIIMNDDENLVRKKSLFSKRFLCEETLMSDVLHFFSYRFIRDYYDDSKELQEWFVFVGYPAKLKWKKLPKTIQEFKYFTDQLYQIQQKYEVTFWVAQTHRLSKHKYKEEILLREFYMKHVISFPNHSFFE